MRMITIRELTECWGGGDTTVRGHDQGGSEKLQHHKLESGPHSEEAWQPYTGTEEGEDGPPPRRKQG